MKIVKNSVVTARYTLKDAQDNLIEEGQEPMVYLHGGYDNIFPKIEEALEGKEAGFSTIIQLNPEDAFGDYDAALVKVEPRNRFPSPLEVGMQFEGMPEETEEDEALIFTVTDIAEDKVVLDGNHPLAGIALRFSLTVESVREASDEEVAHGHVHGAHGHHDDEDDGMGDEYRSHQIH
ncbi:MULTISPECIES: peptidylprolyl isomerase [unclassified Undibacterium]|jgi:FKBP-type peptidyl-prolyl cis-trans isomerase SlyD|uniref:FKBP-type peptidyl-prolyl cis-trans isomerase n=1 Tax=unclassified Undibacterium TaxID=2630295 RepID=UPI00164C2E18|nr:MULTISPECIES: peptidylprolyl isomerase [unclassified Undibacterium]MBC3876887.1 peptidylprolyl isomerase [Undibacterium sp. FT79W]MBC3928553.1 peptidylprolyl isomerase [Undibacterium sp. CY21W]